MFVILIKILLYVNIVNPRSTYELSANLISEKTTDYKKMTSLNLQAYSRIKYEITRDN